MFVLISEVPALHELGFVRSAHCEVCFDWHFRVVTPQGVELHAEESDFRDLAEAVIALIEVSSFLVDFDRQGTARAA